MFIRSLIVCVTTIGFVLGINAATAASKFVPGINDLPLMPGLVLKSETPVVFDTPAGRIIEVFASGLVSGARIRAFYGETLLQLGWKPSLPSGFQRDKELLKIEISEAGNGSRRVRFSVVPKGVRKALPTISPGISPGRK